MRVLWSSEGCLLSFLLCRWCKELRSGLMSCYHDNEDPSSLSTVLAGTLSSAHSWLVQRSDDIQETLTEKRRRKLLTLNDNLQSYSKVRTTWATSVIVLRHTLNFCVLNMYTSYPLYMYLVSLLWLTTIIYDCVLIVVFLFSMSQVLQAVPFSSSIATILRTAIGVCHWCVAAVIAMVTS